MWFNYNRVLPWLGVLGIAGLAIYGASSGQMFTVLAGMLGVFLLVMVIARPHFLLSLTIFAMASEVSLDFLPVQMSLYMMVGVVFCASALLERVWRRGDRIEPQDRAVLFWVLGFTVVMMVTAVIRGSGLKFFGSEKWGGRPYVFIFFAVLVLIHGLLISLNKTQVKRLLYGFCFAGLFPALASIVARYGGSDILSRFIAKADEVAQVATGLVGEDASFRLQVANVAAIYLFLLMWLVQYSKSVVSRMMMILCGILGIVLTGLSGHRISLLYGVVLSACFLMLNVRIPLWARLMNRYTISLVGILSAMILFSSRLPLMFQRSLAWLPFMDLTGDNRIDASITSQWRIEVWRRVWEIIPDYWLLGKGFAFSSGEMLSYVNWTMNDYDFVLTSHNYHNGFINILVDLGLPGIFFTLGFIVVVFKRHYLLLAAKWNSDMLRHFHQVMLAGFCAQILVYLVVGGGVTTLVTLFFWTLMLIQLVRADAKLAVPGSASLNVPSI